MKTVQLRHVAAVWPSSVDKHTHDDELPVQLCNYTDVYKNDIVKPAINLMRATATPDEVARFKLSVGDTVLTKDSEDPHDIGISAYVSETAEDFICGYHLAILRPSVGTHPRYLTWAVRGRPVLDHFMNHSNGISRYGLTQSGLASSPIPEHDHGEQRRIADFLDDRVSRIDQIITARRQQVDLVTEHFRAEVEARLRPFPRLPVRYLSHEILVGIVIQPSKLYTDETDGVPALRGLNVREGEIDQKELVRITPDGHRLNPRSTLRTGDVVVVRTGDAGSAAVVPAACDDWNCIDLVVLRPAHSVSAQYLELALNSAKHEASVAAASSGAMQQHFGVNALGALPIPYPGDSDVAVGRELAALRVATARRSRELLESINRLTEFKQSLITAAVTGELDVTTAGRGIPG